MDQEEWVERIEARCQSWAEKPSLEVDGAGWFEVAGC
jgi:hypothetical protein